MILRRYMIRQVAITTALVLVFLTVLLLGGRMIRYFGIAAEGRLDVSLLFAIIGYNLPYFLELILPLSFFIGLMLVFGRLYVDHEMAVLNGSGISRGRLARLIIPLIVALFIAEAGLSLFGKPWGVRNADTIWQQQSLNSAFDLIRPQSFISNDDYHLYVGSMNEDKTELEDVILVQTPQHNSSQGADESSQLSDDNANNSANAHVADRADRDVIVLAKRAVQVQGENENSPRTQLDLYQGRRYEIDANSQIYNQVSFERYRISISNTPAEVVSETNMATQTLPVLWRAATAQSEPMLAQTSTTDNAPGGQEVRPAQAELGYRLTLPWLMIIAPMLAVPLAQVRPRQGRWLRLLPAILIFTSCALVIISLKNAVLKGSLSVWIYPITIIAFVVFSLYLNWASRIHHRVRFRWGQRKLANSSDQNSIDKSKDKTDKGGQS